MNFFSLSVLAIVGSLSGAVVRAEVSTAGVHTIGLESLHAGQHGQVWTVFRGTEAEPFDVEVTGVVQNALGPGKSLILCQLTDPRVQNMGAVAGMSGSPLYIEGKLAGALSYQIQRFETVRYAGFTPAADLAEVRDRADAVPGVLPSLPTIPISSKSTSALDSFSPLRPAFTVSGLSPRVADLFSPAFTALGLEVSALGGSLSSAGDSPLSPTTETAGSSSGVPVTLRAGSAVSVALTTGDITLAGTGTVSRVDGNRITAFGHPMLSLGDVELPMCSAEIVTILPSTLQSSKIANTGRVIGTITQDRLSAVSGTLGAGPAMIKVEVNVAAGGNSSRPARTLHFNVVRQAGLTPTLIATGITQAIVGSNDAGLTNGFRLTSIITYSPAQTLTSRNLFAGPQAFAQGLQEFVRGLSQDLQNPYEKTFPERVTFSVEPLAENPAVTFDLFQLSRTSARAGDTVLATIGWRDYQGAAHRETIPVPVDSSWAGKSLDVILAPGRAIDELTGHPSMIATAQLRSFNAYLAAVRDNRPNDGLVLAVLEKSALFSDQTIGTPETPGSIERIARTADETRFKKTDGLVSLWEQHLLADKLAGVLLRRPLRVTD